MVDVEQRRRFFFFSPTGGGASGCHMLFMDGGFEFGQRRGREDGGRLEDWSRRFAREGVEMTYSTFRGVCELLFFGGGGSVPQDIGRA